MKLKFPMENKSNVYAKLVHSIQIEVIEQTEEQQMLVRMGAKKTLYTLLVVM